jgi:protein gp37
MGCEGCELWTDERKDCYAGILHTRHGGKNPGYAPSFEQVTIFPGRVAEACRWSDLLNRRRPLKPWLDGMPRLVFLSDMSDACCKAVSFEYLESEIVSQVDSQQGQRHVWLWLTKRPQRMAEFSRWLKSRRIPWPPNLWAGTSVTSSKWTKRIDDLLQVGDKSTVRFLSLEPQWEEIDLHKWLPKLDWLIQGGQSGYEAQPFHVEWAYAMRDQCKKTGTPFFLKQLGAHAFHDDEQLDLRNSHGGDWTEWPTELRCRELPKYPKTAEESRE